MEPNKSSYEKMLDHNYAFVGESSETMIARKVEVLKHIFSFFPAQSTVKILDVGCGVGLFEKRLCDDPRIAELTGIDPDFPSLQEARKRNLPKCIFSQTDGKTIPFPDETFDIVFTASTLHHIEPPDRPGVMKEIARVTKPGGFVGIFEHNPYNPITLFFVNICPIDRGVKLLTPRNLRNLAGGAGLNVVDTRFIIFFPSFLKVLCANEYRLKSLPIGTQYFVISKKCGEKTN